MKKRNTRLRIANFIEDNTAIKLIPSKYVRPIWMLTNKHERIKYKNLISDNIDGYSLSGFLDKNCLFVHIPKAAGISIAQSIFGNLGGGHVPLHRYEMMFDNKHFKNFFKFTFVRNPASRLLSAYKFLKKGGITEEDKNWANKFLSEYKDFNQFVYKWVNEDSINSWTHFLPQTYFLKNRAGKIDMDFIGKHESINSDYNRLSNILDVKEKLKHLNKTGNIKNTSYIDSYNIQTLEKVKEIYNEDINNFGYSEDIDNAIFLLKQRN